MRKITLLLSLQCILLFTLHATSYNTIVIDGLNNGWDADETFTNCSAANNAYFTWDADYLYYGIDASEADFDNMATFIYLDIDPTGTNGSALAYAWGDNMTTPFNSDWVFVIKNGLTNPNDYIQVMQYNNTNSTWEQAYSAVGAIYILDGTDTVVKFGMGLDYREFKISRSIVGNPNAIKTCMFTEQQWNSYWRYMVWPSNDWVDAGRTSGQAIPHNYGFILEDNIVPFASPYYDANITSWTGTSSTSWATDGNWSGGTAPDQNTLILLPASATTSVDASGASCYDMSIASGGVLTVTTSGELTVAGNLYNNTGTTGLVVQSASGANGSLIYDGSIEVQATIQNYVTDGQWHSWCAPVSNLTAEDLYLNASPEVWLTEYDEATKGYTFISALTEPLGDMKGWMLWVGASTPKTYDFTGPLRPGILGSDNNMVRSQAGDYGFNYVGNPFSSAIDWNSASGWTKTNMNNAIYIFNNGGWTTYINGVGLNDGTQYIAMNQGFFVQVTDGAGSYPEYGTLKMDNDVCIHNGVGFLKETTTIPDSLIRLQLEENDITDETVIRFAEDATEGFDGNYDAAKFFSYAEDRPQIYSTANNMMSINGLPGTVQNINIDVAGNHGNTMTISATELVDFSNVYLLDGLTGIETDLSTDDYIFTYDQDFTNRFTIHFTITDINENIVPKISFSAYSKNSTIKLRFDDSENYNISLYNLIGQEIYNKENVQSNIDIPYIISGYYLVKVNAGNRCSVKKVIVN